MKSDFIGNSPFITYTHTHTHEITQVNCLKYWVAYGMSHLIESSFLAFSLDNCGEKLSRESTKTSLMCEVLSLAWKLESYHWQQIQSVNFLEGIVLFLKKYVSSFYIWITGGCLPVTLSGKNGIPWRAAANSDCSGNQSPGSFVTITIIIHHYSAKVFCAHFPCYHTEVREQQDWTSRRTQHRAQRALSEGGWASERRASSSALVSVNG